MARNGVITRKCAYHGCNNRISSDKPTFPYCHIEAHQNGGKLESERRAGLVGGISWGEDPSIQPPSLSIPTRDIAIGLHSQACDLDEHDLNIVLDSYEEVRQGRDFSIPGNIPPEVNLELHDTMFSGGFDGRRLRLYDVKGFNRRRDGRVDNNPGYSHTVIGIDPDSTSPRTVIDGLVPAFAPIRRSDQGVPLEDTIPSGSTPYTEYPWIGRSRDYLNGDHMWWDSIERRTGR